MSENDDCNEELFDDYNLDFLDHDFASQNPLGDCYLSGEELDQFLAPSTEKWKEFLPSDNEAVITMNSAKESNWKLAKEEIDHVKGRMIMLLSVGNSEEVTLEAIVSFILGPSSKAASFIKEELELDGPTYLKFMSTLCMQSAYRTSSLQLFHVTSLLKDSNIMTAEEYNLIWKEMSEKKKLSKSQISTSRRDSPLWESFENIVNELLRSISVTGRDGRVPIALDDDKIWMHILDSGKRDLFNLKYTTHVKPNRKGIIAHTAVSTALNIPLGIVFEKTKDNTIDCFKRCLDYLFGQNGSANLRNVSVHSDRGYMIPNLVFEYLLSSGAEVVGTVKRMAQCWPFTYDQNLRDTDNRTLIEGKGAATLYLKWCKAGPKYLFASAFRNGSGRVATAISTMHTQHQWEGVVYNDSEFERYKDDKSSLIYDFFARVSDLDEKYETVESEDEKEVLKDIIDNKIEPYTLRQGESYFVLKIQEIRIQSYLQFLILIFMIIVEGTADWHYMRKFSLTSSQASKAFVLAFPDYKNDESWICVAKYLYGDDWREKLNVASAPIVDNENLESSSSGTENELFMYFNEIVLDEDDELANQALQFLKEYIGSMQPGNNNDEEGNRNFVEEKVIENEVEAKEIVDRLHLQTRKRVLALLSEHISTERHRKSPTTKDLIGWLQQPNKIRNFWFYKVEGLKGLIKDRGITLTSGRKTIIQMREVLAGMSNTSAVTEPTTGRDLNGLNPRDAVTKAILIKSFLPHQKGKAREHCSLGHRLEVPILDHWIQVVANGDGTPTHGITAIKGAYSAGLAAKRGAIYAKDSIDFVVTVVEENDPDDVKTWGFEAKGRVTARTAAEEERNLHLFNNPHVRIWDFDVHKEVANESERFQVLQHAFVYDFETVVLAISDDQSFLIRSTIIDFTTELKDHFGHVLEEIKNISLGWAYPPTSGNSTNRRSPNSTNTILTIPDEILNIAEGIPTINGAHTLQGAANIWSSLTQLSKPFPSFHRLIPAVYAFWNTVKGGSDTTTKLMDDCIIRIPKKYLNTETVAMARLISLLFVLIHRLNQLFSANNDTNFYTSLFKYRKDASRRSTFHVSLLLCRDIFNKMLAQATANSNTANLRNQQQSPSSTTTRSSTNPARQVRRRNPMRQHINGVIPERVPFGATLPMKTPTKMSLLSKKNSTANIPKEIKEMLQRCTGQPMKSNPIKRGKCALCGTNTPWYCVGCKRWLCMERRSVKDNNKCLKLYNHKVREQDVTFLKVCFHEAHEEAWKVSSKENDDSGYETPPLI